MTIFCAPVDVVSLASIARIAHIALYNRCSQYSPLYRAGTHLGDGDAVQRVFHTAAVHQPTRRAVVVRRLDRPLLAVHPEYRLRRRVRRHADRPSRVVVDEDASVAAGQRRRLDRPAPGVCPEEQAAGKTHVFRYIQCCRGDTRCCIITGEDN